VLSADATSPLSGYTNFFESFDFNTAVDPQFTGGVNVGSSAFNFNGSGNEVLVGTNGTLLYLGQPAAGFPTNPALAQSVFSVGNTPTTGSSRGSLVKIFNQMSELTQLSPFYSPVSQFGAFTGYTGLGVTTAFGFGVLPAPNPAAPDTIVLPVVTPATVSNPILM
jgi:hypothetical protein